jgi:hypothetical protein
MMMGFHFVKMHKEKYKKILQVEEDYGRHHPKIMDETTKILWKKLPND